VSDRQRKRRKREGAGAEPYLVDSPPSPATSSTDRLPFSRDKQPKIPHINSGLGVKVIAQMLRFVSFRSSRTGLIRPGLLLPEAGAAIDLIRAQIVPHNNMNESLLSLIQMMSTDQSLEAKLRDLLASPPSDAVLSSHQMQITAPIPFPIRNLFCVGKNYMDHVQETAAAAAASSSSTGVAADVTIPKPKYPQFFTKVPQTVIGPSETVPSHSLTTKWLDYEAEVAVIIGQQGVDIPVERAMDHVFGYTIANDISARDVQKRHTQFMKGKCLDRTCPMGPMIVHKNDLNGQELAIKLWVNNQLRQDSCSNQMIFTIPEIIHQLSQGMTLYPGDIILTGTPAGVGYAMTPPQTLKYRDQIRIEIEGLGTLENEIGE
jgi:2-keto-4-pentenoate hydratase/2-oxohepta-3-ene-1,7-dioic acid hydratase in catechol pathway